MPPFQSRLFNWISRSLPFRWGKKARQFIDRYFKELPQIVENLWQDLIPNPQTEMPSPKDRAKLPPWRRFLARLQTKPIAKAEQRLAESSKAVVPSRWRTLLEEAINYFLRRPKLSSREREYENESGHWPPLPPAADQITEIKLEPEDPPLHAWIETQATSLGYAYSPIVNFLLWLDQWIARIEEWFLKLWRRLWDWLTHYRPA